MSHNFLKLAISHVNSETNPPLLIIRVVCKHLRQFLGTNVGVATLPICCTIEYDEGILNFSRNWIGLNNLCEIFQVALFPEWYRGSQIPSVFHIPVFMRKCHQTLEIYLVTFRLYIIKDMIVPLNIDYFG